MSYPVKIKIIIWPILMILLASAVWAQDPGVADTVRLDSVLGTITGTITMPVWLTNDEELTAIVIPLVMDGYSGWAKFDSISYIGSRLIDPQILDAREGFVFATDTYSVASLVVRFTVTSGTALPAGAGKLCDLWFTPLFGGQVAIGGFPVSPHRYVCGDANGDGDINVGDAVHIINYVFKGGTAPDPLEAGDANCDETINVGDAVYIVNYIFKGGFEPYCPGLQLMTASLETFTPQFIAGTIDIACDYLVGDTRLEGSVSTSSYLGLQKGYHGCNPADGGPPYVADVNSDRRVDLRDALHLYRYIFSGGPIGPCGTYVPPVYDDPGLPDTIWISNDTLVVGTAATIDIGIANDEPIFGLALGLEWTGSANLQFLDSFSTPYITERIPNRDLMEYYCRCFNGVSPDTIYMASHNWLGNSMSPGSGAIYHARVIPLSPGTVTFRIVKFLLGSEAMLVTESESAILPVLIGGRITILPY